MAEVKGNANGAFMKVVVCVMGAITLISTGWAASATMGLFDARALDVSGTQKARELDIRVTVLEKTLEPRLASIQAALTIIENKLDHHVQADRPSP